MKRMSPSFHAADLDGWRVWLETYHSTERVVWLLFYKKGETEKRCITYDDALDEALCWGWIDSLVRRIDDVTYARKFTRRTNTSKWSVVNIHRMKRLLAEKRVRPAGLKAISEQVLRMMLSSREKKPNKTQWMVPVELERALKTTPQAKMFFESLAPSYKRNYVAWVSTAKQAETRQRRAHEAARLLSKGQKVLLK